MISSFVWHWQFIRTFGWKFACVCVARHRGRRRPGCIRVVSSFSPSHSVLVADPSAWRTGPLSLSCYGGTPFVHAVLCAPSCGLPRGRIVGGVLRAYSYPLQLLAVSLFVFCFAAVLGSIRVPAISGKQYFWEKGSWVLNKTFDIFKKIENCTQFPSQPIQKISIFFCFFFNYYYFLHLFFNAENVSQNPTPPFLKMQRIAGAVP